MTNISITEYRAIVAKPKRAKPKPAPAITDNRPASEHVQVTLTLPPSVNTCWANVPGKGRVLTQDYRRWIAAAERELISQKAGRIVGRYAVVITAGRSRARADIDNRIKPILDLLKERVTADDSLCERVSAGWSDALPTGTCTVSVRPV